MSDYKILIGGKLQQGKGAPIEVVNPANERVIARLNTATPAQLDEAIAAAGDAFKEWRQTPVQTRQKLLAELVEKIREQADSLAELLVAEQGKPLEGANLELTLAEAFGNYFAEATLTDELLVDDEVQRIELVRKPLGVVAAIIASSAGTLKRLTLELGGNDAARANGTIIAGGELREGPGYFVPLTVVRDIEDGTAVVDEEPFGPILPIIRYSDLDDVIARANASEYGLGGSVWSSDVGRAWAVAERLECGSAWVNQHAAFAPNIPFPAAKQSGIGVEWGEEGIREYTRVQVVNAAKQ
jgi:acyl-CoA reductase-like NAD-dependent aldehyde dehydrogenase